MAMIGLDRKLSLYATLDDALADIRRSSKPAKIPGTCREDASEEARAVRVRHLGGHSTDIADVMTDRPDHRPTGM